MSRRIGVAALAAMIGGAGLPGADMPAMAQPYTSSYSKLDLGQGCQWRDGEGNAVAADDVADGGCAICPGTGANVIRICEGDLRQSAAYGPEGLLGDGWHSFAQFNWIGATVEWRLDGSEPVAAIHRQFVENLNDSGEPDAANRGQVLVISTVARPGRGPSCPVGHVDARANANANELARQVADSVAPAFVCGVDRPRFHGMRGPYSGTPGGVDE
ncbi:MAG: hypothetical protein BroJett030_25620 [Alphaproteobacteria bacterium]|nr:MAG: hypothetical protein BroJett030_25620 [Alphaproteobacteria bacterium]